MQEKYAIGTQKIKKCGIAEHGITCLDLRNGLNHFNGLPGADLPGERESARKEIRWEICLTQISLIQTKLDK